MKIRSTARAFVMILLPGESLPVTRPHSIPVFSPRGTRMTSPALDLSADATLAYDVPARATAPAAGYGVCTNCGLARRGEYCAHCGQRAVRGRLTVPAIAHQVANDVLNLDRGILFTALELTRRPGDAIRDYVQGRRVRYVGPVKYFVLTVALTTFATTQLGVLDVLASDLFHEDGPSAAATARQASAFMSQWMTLLMAVGVPFTAVVTRRLFRRADCTYAEHLALNLYSYGHQSLGLIVALVLGHVLQGLEGVLLTSWMLFSAGYFAWTCSRFFRMRPRSAVPRALLSAVLGTTAVFLAALLVLGTLFGVVGL